MVDLKELSTKPEKLAPGHRLCPGCAAPIIVRQVLRAIDKPVVIANATGCLEVSTTPYPFTSWKVPWIHNAFENAAATLSGVETAYRALSKKGVIKKEIKFIAFGGDGGTSDIGLQSLSGAVERGHNFLYIQYDNEAYANTGFQRSSATPLGASTTTDPAGKVRKGKQEFRKNITQIMAAHNMAYVAQTTPAHFSDLIMKVQKAIAIGGPTFINIISPCIPGWKIKSDETIKLAKLAVQTCFWPLYEVENGKYKLNYDPGESKKPIEEWIKTQGRFKHLLLPENRLLLEKLQKHVDQEWEKLKKLCSI